MVAHTETFVVSDHPVCGAKVGFSEIFLMPQPPLLTRRGMGLQAAIVEREWEQVGEMLLALETL